MDAEKARCTNQSEMCDDDDEEEPGEVIESAPPLKVGEERLLNSSGLKKKLLVPGHAWDSPEFGDEVTVHYVGTLLDGTKFDSTRDRDLPLRFKLGNGEVVSGLDHAIITMKKGETALFTLPPELGYGVGGAIGVPCNSRVQFEVELLSWISVLDVCKDGGIIKKILEKGESDAQPGDLDEVLVKYQVALANGTLVAKTPDQGVEFYVKDGHFCSALPKTIKTMKRGEKVKLIVQPRYAFAEVGRHAENEFPPIPPSSVLSADLELVSFKPVIDVSGDSKVFKKILKEGEGTFTANEGATVTIRYIARLADGTIFEKRGFEGQNPLQFIADEEQVIVGLDRAVATMKKGELAILTIDPQYGYGSIEVNQDLAIVPPSSTIVYEVEMLDVIKEKATWEMSNCERIEAATRKKEEGNLLFKGGKYQRAEKKYDKAADYVGEDASFGDDDQKKVKALRVSCWLNAAACALKLRNFQGAIELSSKVLDMEFLNVKALYRRAQAYMETSDLYLAELDIKKSLEADPENREVKLLQKSLKHLKAESNKRDAKLYKNMFSRVDMDSPIATKKLKAGKEDNKKGDEEAATLNADNNVAMSSAPPDGGMVD